MELMQETLTVSRTVCRGATQTVSSGDIIVPDTKADILKIIQVDADACVTDKSIRDGKLILSGKTDLKILYIPDSDTDRISSITSSFDFSQEITCRGAEDGMGTIASANVSRAEFSVINSRKLHIKTVIALDYEVTETAEAGFASEADEESGAQVKREVINVRNISDICEHNFSIQENIELQSGQPQIKDLLKTDVQITDTEYKTVTGRIILKGTLALCALYTTDDGGIEHTDVELPFTEVVESEGALDNSECCIEYAVTGSVCEACEDSDGDTRVINAEIRVQAQIKVIESCSVDMITDCYVPYMHTELIKEKLDMEEVIANPSAQNTLRETVDLPPGVPPVKSVYNVVMKPYLSKTEPGGGRLLCEGRIEAYVLYLSDSADNPVYSIRREIPFGFALNYEDAGGGLTANVKAEVRHSGYNLNSAGEVELRCILSLNADIIRRRSDDIITGAEVTDIEDDGERGIVIYFVQAGDELWDIAKRYAVPVSGVTQYNELSDGDRLKTGQRLFIPA